jgi:DNA-binding transcriptional regulator YdaS (Cro superfamily)
MIQEIIRQFGSQVELARQLGVTQAAVAQWVSDEKVPPYRAIQIERITDGQFKAVDIIGDDRDE